MLRYVAVPAREPSPDIHTGDGIAMGADPRQMTKRTNYQVLDFKIFIIPTSCFAYIFLFFTVAHSSLQRRFDLCRNWERGGAVSFLGIFVSNFRYSVFAGFFASPRSLFVSLYHSVSLIFDSCFFT
jgi:hypothetical protein